MNPAQIICRKRDGHELTPEEIGLFVRGFTDDSIPAYQMSALAMAVFFQGMTWTETVALTEHMLRSGKVLRWPAGTPLADKHSTGGIGDKVSIILAPLLACSGLHIPMISGRGLGATGGTLDKLEAIPGFRTNLSLTEMQHVVERVGCVINGATDDLAPADRQLYRLRDVTGTVPSIPLITASIMSKKLAEGLDALVLDVKCGSGAFMKTRTQSQLLATSLVRVGQQMGLKTSALITDMNQPLGRMVGHAVEVDESVAALQGNGPADLMHVTLELAAEALRLTGQIDDRQAARDRLQGVIASGAALDKLAEMTVAQGGDLDAPRPRAPATEVLAERSGTIASIDTEQLGYAVIEMGGGRRVIGAPIDYSVGFEMLVRIGDQVAAGQPLVRVFARPENRDTATGNIANAISLQDQPCDPLPHILERIEE